MEQFCILERKVREREAISTTLIYQYDNVTKTAVDLKKLHVGDCELTFAFFRRVFSAEKKAFPRLNLTESLF